MKLIRAMAEIIQTPDSSWCESNVTERNAFLIQSSGKAAEHIAIAFSDRTYADEVIKHGFYRNESWDTSARDQDFGKAKVGDYIIHYCTTNVESFPGQVKNIFEIAAIEKIDDDIKKALNSGRITKAEGQQLEKRPHVFRLKLHKTLNKGLELSSIRKWVQDGTLSNAMNNCGRLGFNICRVEWKDYEVIMEWDKTQPVEPSLALGALLEEDLRSYIVSLATLEPIFGKDYVNCTLYTEPDGRTTGELYDTHNVGQIDLLYRDKSGNLLVIELKRTEDTPDKAVGQIARYLGWVEENLAKNLRVEGLVVARSASEELKYAVKALKHCKLFTFEVHFKFNRAV